MGAIKQGHIGYFPISPVPSSNMLRPDIYWLREIDGVRLAIMPRPRGGEWLADELVAMGSIGVETVVSLLEPREASELELSEEASLCMDARLEYLSFPIPDRGVPRDSRTFAELIAAVEQRLRSGRSVAVHCRAGIGRSGLVAACVLAAFGASPSDAFECSHAPEGSPFRTPKHRPRGSENSRAANRDPFPSVSNDR